MDVQSFLNNDKLLYLLQKFKTQLSGYVKKVDGKGLSTNDYTTEEKNKLAGIENNANNYSLPTASNTTLGGVKVGSGLDIDETGSLSAQKLPDVAVNDGKVVTGLTDNNLQTTNVKDLKLKGITPVSGGYVSEGATLGGAFSALDEAVKNAIAGGGEVNQNAFSNVVVGSTTVEADSKTDSLELVAGENVTITPDASKDQIKFSVNYNNATQSKAGLLASEDKTKLDGIAEGAEVNVQSDWTNTDTTADSYIKNKPTKLSDFSNDKNFIDNTVDNLTNYYLKSQIYTQEEIDSKFATIHTIELYVCQTGEYDSNKVPTIASPNSNTIYLVPKDETSTNNTYFEYIYKNGAFEKIGDTDVDLSNYWNNTTLVAMSNTDIDTIWNQVFAS